MLRMTFGCLGSESLGGFRYQLLFGLNLGGRS